MQTAEDLELAALRALQYGIEPLGAYILRRSPKLLPASHTRPIIDLFNRSMHEEVYATVAFPPRLGKTTTYEHGLSWRNVYSPACLNFYTTFANDLATSTSRNVRRLTREAGVPLATDAQQVDDWRTALGGGLKATSTGGSITGRGCNGGIIVADDMIKGREQAESLLQRNRAWDYLRADVMSRLMPGASMIVGNTRWHPDDPIGRLMRDGLGLKWTHIELPAVCDENGVAVDEQVDPERARSLWPEGGYTMERWARIRARGEYDWWSLYQQQPRPPGGSLFPGEPERFDLSSFTWNGKRGLFICDPAATDKTSSDYSVAALCAMEGYGDESIMYVLDLIRGQWTIPALVRRLIDFQRGHRLNLPIAVEAFGAFQAIPQMLREQAPGIRLLELGGDPKDPKTKLYRSNKFTRSQPASRAWKGDGKAKPGRIRIPINAAWAHAWIQEHNDFTGLGDVHDDQVDVTSHGWNRLYQESPAGPRMGAYEAAGA